MTRYVSRPVEVDAAQWSGDRSDLPADWFQTGHVWIDQFDKLVVQTPHGAAGARVGDYIVHGTAGEYYPVPRAVFEHKYEAA